VDGKLALAGASRVGGVGAVALVELLVGTAVGVEIGGRKLCLARAEGEVYALADNCTHRDFPLSLGEVDAATCTVTCEWHGAAFSLRDGAATCPPATRPVPVYGARVEQGAVYVDLPD
jgi:3-phenylpropionate/trans-cinnamate dioxygenase ferredoxin subunit